MARPGSLGLVLSGGGSRAAYQVGALKALSSYFADSANLPNIIIGSSIGSINGILLAACLNDGIDTALDELDKLWRERTFRNTFAGSPSGAFFRAVKTAVLQYMSPGPNPTSDSIFNPQPLMDRIDGVLKSRGGLKPEDRAACLQAVAVMTTVEGTERKPLLFLSSHKSLDESHLCGASFEVYHVDDLTAKHGFASAALPSVLPPVELDTDQGKVRLVDGGISSNVPVDPAVRLGAERVIVIDVSGRNWWLTRYDEPLDTRPDWEVPAGLETFCMRPPETSIIRCKKPLGPLLKSAVSGSRRKFIAALGPTWPIFTLLKNKLGEEVAYETVSYVALDPDYLAGLLERGYNETIEILRNKEAPSFTRQDTLQNWVDEVVGEDEHSEHSSVGISP